MGMGGQRHALAALTPPPTPVPVVYIGGSVDPRTVVDEFGKSRHPPGFDPHTTMNLYHG